MVLPHFENAQQLLLTLTTQELERVDADVARRLEGARTFPERVRALTGPFLDQLEQRGLAFWMLVVEPPERGPFEDWQRARNRVVEAFIADVVVEDFPMDRRTAELAAAVLKGAFDNVCSYWLDHPEVDRAEIESRLDEVAEAVLGRLAGTRGRRRR